VNAQSNPKPRLDSVSSSCLTTEEPASHHYWKSLSGFQYLEMIRRREAAGCPGYAQQEQVLTSLVEAQRRHLGRDVEVLEFGCGFGRHATYLSRLPGIRYHGYDFSETMVEPLRQSPPPGLLPLEERVLVGPDVRAAVGARRFDVVFTVSVLIHNPPELIPALLQALTEVTSPDGVICLVENQAVPFSLRENGWHQGCWLHAYADALPEGWALHLGQGLVETHDVYLLCRQGGDPRRVFRMNGVSLPPAASEPLSPAELHELGLPKLRSWAEAQGPGGAGGAEARVSELEEQLALERERAARRQRLQSLSDELARMRAPRTALPVRVPPSTAAAEAPRGRGVLVDDALDTRWAHLEPRLSRCAHVFHQEWSGIRAASGFLPGRKIAITAERPLTAAEHRRIIEHCTSTLTRTVIFQGHSPNTSELIRLMRHTLGSSVRLLAVWHGATTQFHFPSELDGFTELLALRQEGLLDGLACVKPEMHSLSELIFPQTLLNLPPRVESMPLPDKRPTRAAFIPTPGNWWKNFHTNLLVAASHPLLERVYVTSAFETRPQLPLRNEVVNVGRLQRAELFHFFHEVEVLLNVTLTECQPMTALEGLAFGVPCLTGPLSLGPLDAHPYQKLMQVAGTGALLEIRSALERVLELRRSSPAELRGMMQDYTRVLHAEAIRRYLEFTQP
jgi:SAM-dependent methyltransferase